MSVPRLLLSTAAGVALVAGCRAPAPVPGHSGHGGEAHLSEAPPPEQAFEGFVRGGRRGLDEAKRSGRGAMLFFAATW